MAAGGDLQEELRAQLEARRRRREEAEEARKMRRAPIPTAPAPPPPPVDPERAKRGRVLYANNLKILRSLLREEIGLSKQRWKAAIEPVVRSVQALRAELHSCIQTMDEAGLRELTRRTVPDVLSRIEELDPGEPFGSVPTLRDATVERLSTLGRMVAEESAVVTDEMVRLGRDADALIEVVQRDADLIASVLTERGIALPPVPSGEA